MEDLILTMVEPLVEFPDDIEIEEVEKGVFSMRLAADDVGRVIGRRGRTAKSLRTVLRAAGSSTVTSAVLGSFRSDFRTRQEFFANISMGARTL